MYMYVTCGKLIYDIITDLLVNPSRLLWFGLEERQLITHPSRNNNIFTYTCILLQSTNSHTCMYNAHIH